MPAFGWDDSTADGSWGYFIGHNNTESLIMQTCVEDGYMIVIAE